MNKQFRMIASVLISALAIIGCSDPSSPSTANFEKVIQTHFEQNENFPHCFFRYNFPIQVSEIQLKMMGYKKELEFLKNTGIVDVKTREVTQGRRTHKEFTFSVSNQGRDLYIQDRGLCMGKPKLTGLKDVSEPYQERGKTYVRGTYTWTIELPEWAMKPSFYDSGLFTPDIYYFKFNKLSKDEDREDYFVLTLNDKGWQF